MITQKITHVNLQYTIVVTNTVVYYIIYIVENYCIL